MFNKMLYLLSNTRLSSYTVTKVEIINELISVARSSI